MTESGEHTYLRSHQITGDVLRLDLKAEAAAVLTEAKQSPAGRAAKTLAKDGPLRLTILGVAAGASLHEHKAGGPVSIEVREGSVDISLPGGSASLGAGDVLVLASDISHSVLAHTDSVLLLSIVMTGTDAPR